MVMVRPVLQCVKELADFYTSTSFSAIVWILKNLSDKYVHYKPMMVSNGFK